ncbi:universal stress protein [Desulfopila inferna]|uniref:universal stress protein n=1 Tax=Desulfopila inferna TaxID=468528 RepID=UPI001962AE8F|nr:universal stress protein [Desulfopila inferna]MBM9606633.1 universal stress protein [Desulfopila inferna]
MISKILVPIAFSKYSKGILNFASSLAKPLGARLLITNVVNERDIEAVERISSFGYKVDGDHYIATIQKERIGILETMLEELQIADDDYDFIFLAGDPSTELLRLVLKEHVDLVVMGTKAKDLRSIFTGSVAERMFRKSPVSIVSYRDKEIANALEKKLRKELHLKSAD